MEHRNSRETPAPRASQMIGTRRTAMRVMHRKSVGVVAVYEQDPVAAASGSRALVFESPKGVVRLEHFPSEWQRLTDDELTQIRRAAS